MPNIRDVVSMLEDSGSKKLYASNGHIKYKLPNGNLFVTSGTPSDQRSYNNAMAQLRRQLRVTHPDIANRHRNLPKNKRHTSNTLGELMTLKGIGSIIQPISGFTAVPGTQPAEAEFQIIEPESTPPPEAEPEPLRRHNYPPIRRKREETLQPGKPKTLSQPQLSEANRILHTEGEAAMNAYLNQCRNGLVDVSRELIAERSPEPIIAPQNRVPEIRRHTEEDEMSSVLERARTELQTTNNRLENYTAQMNELKTKQETDILRQAQLEEYIAKHEALVNEAAKLLTEILPPEAPVAPPAPPQKQNRKGRTVRSSNTPRLSFSMKDIEARAFPLLRARGNEFTIADFLEAVDKVGFEGPKPIQNQIANWLYPYLKSKNCQIEKCGAGRFTFTKQSPAVYHRIPQGGRVEAHA